MELHSETEQIWADQSSMKSISDDVCDPEMGIDLHYEAKQIHYAHELHHMV